MILDLLAGQIRREPIQEKRPSGILLPHGLHTFVTGTWVLPIAIPTDPCRDNRSTERYLGKKGLIFIHIVDAREGLLESTYTRYGFASHHDIRRVGYRSFLPQEEERE